jgi:hypothetical protein
MSDTPVAARWASLIKAARKRPQTTAHALALARRRRRILSRRRRSEALSKRMAFLKAVRAARRAAIAELKVRKASNESRPRLSPEATRFKPASFYLL